MTEEFIRHWCIHCFVEASRGLRTRRGIVWDTWRRFYQPCLHRTPDHLRLWSCWKTGILCQTIMISCCSWVYTHSTEQGEVVLGIAALNQLLSLQIPSSGRSCETPVCHCSASCSLSLIGVHVRNLCLPLTWVSGVVHLHNNTSFTQFCLEFCFMCFNSVDVCLNYLFSFV